MLPQQVNGKPPRRGSVELSRQTYLAIEKFLKKNGPSTVSEIATAIGLRTSSITARLHVLRADGLVREAGKRLRAGMNSGTPHQLWENGTAPAVAAADKRRCVIAPAKQLGFQRDPLVAALFGAGPARQSSHA